MARICKIYVDVNSGYVYDANGNQLTRDTAPYITYKEKVQLQIQYLTAPPGTPPVDADLSKYTNLTGYTIASSAVIDNNRNHYDEGALNTGYSGVVTSIAVKTLEAVPRLKSGELLLINSAGEQETVAFTNYTVTNSVYTFTVSDTLTYTYLANDVARVKETPIIKTENSGITKTGQNTGLFLINLDAKTQTFQKLAEGNSEIENCYFEQQIFETTDVESPIFTLQFSFRCLGVLDDGGVVPPASASDFYTKVQIDALLAAKADTEHTHDAYLVKASNLSDLSDASTARTNLGLGDSATKNVGTASGTVAEGDHTHTTSAVTDFDTKVSNNTDVAANTSARVTNGNSHDHSGGDGAQIDHTTLSNIGTNTHSQIDTHISSTSNPHSVTASQSGAVATSGDETVAGVKTFSSFPVTPSSAPTSDYQVANKKYVDDNITSNATSIQGVAVDSTSPTNGQQLIYSSTSGKYEPSTPGGGGDVTGPSSSTDNAVVRFDSTSGKAIQNSLVTVDDNGSVNIPSGESYKINGTALAASDVNAAASGANSDITSLSGLTTALSVAQGGTGATTASDARTNFGLGTAAVATTGTSSGNVPTRPADNSLSADTISEITSDTGITLDGVTARDSFLEVSEITAPDSPASDKLRIYAKDDSGTTKLYTKDSSGTETELGSGGSGSTSDTSWTGSNWTSTTASPSQRAVEEALDNVGVDTLASSLAESDNGKPVIASYTGYAAVTSGGVAKWTLQNVLTDSFGSYTLTNSGLTFSEDSSFPLGSRYVAVANGSSYAYCSDAGLPSGTSDRTLCAWVKTSSTANDQIFFNYGTAGTSGHGVQLYISSSGYVGVSGGGAGYGYVTTSNAVNNGNWHHITFALSSTGTAAKIYIDGTLIGSGSFSTWSTTLGGTLRIGEYVGGGSYYYTGSLSDLRIYSRALTATEITSIYNGETGGEKKYTLGDSLNFGICQGRLTLSTGVPVPTSDVTAATTLYFTPYNGNRIALYYSSAWKVISFSEVSLSISSLTASTNYDIWGYYTGSALALEALAWTDATTRATALTTQDGIYVKTGDATRRYLGTIRITSTTGQCEDSTTKRFVWNYYNQIDAIGQTYNSNTSWTYSTATWREYNAGSGQYRFQFVLGITRNLLIANAPYATCTATFYGGFGKDSTTSVLSSIGSFTINNNSVMRAPAAGLVNFSEGYHYLTQLEEGGGTSATVYGYGAYINFKY